MKKVYHSYYSIIFSPALRSGIRSDLSIKVTSITVAGKLDNSVMVKAITVAKNGAEKRDDLKFSVGDSLDRNTPQFAVPSKTVIVLSSPNTNTFTLNPGVILSISTITGKGESYLPVRGRLVQCEERA